jgi:U32 family peptidase
MSKNTSIEPFDIGISVLPALSQNRTMPTVELLAPAGDWDCARAAVENGADAIYFGLDVGFNARARATNFHVEQLPKLMDMLHRQGVRGYVTLNTLVFTDELPRLEENIRILAAAGVDAVLVQDLGAVQLIRQICPEMVIHASTQMTLTNAQAIEQVREFGIQRVVLARELSLREIKLIRSATDMPLEVFVHGALCVAYSGQCLTSESLGGRSANRGQCAQACRLPYEMICDGQQRDLGPVRYLLSPQDLAAYDLVPQLIDAGVCSLKIEGRLKTPEYVANVCQQYRRAIDQTLQGQHQRLSPDQKNDLEMSFSRGFSPGWLEGCDHKQLVPGESSAKRGVLLGTLYEQRGPRLAVDLVCSLATGDGIVLEGDRLAGKEIGGRVYEIWQDGQRKDQAVPGRAQIALQHGLLDGVILPNSLRLYKTDDPQLTKRLRRSFESADPIKKIPIDIELNVEVGQPLRARVYLPSVQVGDRPGEPITVDVESAFTPEEARKHPISQEKLHEQLDRLGGTVYRLGQLQATIVGQPMVPLSVLGELRHAIIEKVDSLRSTLSLACSPDQVTLRMLKESQHSQLVQSTEAEGSAPQLRVLCRSLAQLKQVLQAGALQVIADFHDLREYRKAIELAESHQATIELATLRIHKPGEDGLFHALRKASQSGQRPIGWLVRSLAAIRYCSQHQLPFAVDFSLNVTNPLTASRMLQWGASRVTASYDLNRDQLLELVGHCRPSLLEVVVHQHMPMFHMEHCVFCSVLSPGKNKSDCGRPCDVHDVKLKDRVGSEHVLHADIGCRNTLYNATAQSGAEAVSPLLKLGLRQFRIELLRDSQMEHTKRLVQLYQELISGRMEGAAVWQELRADNRIGVTRGTLEQSRNPLAIL